MTEKLLLHNTLSPGDIIMMAYAIKALHEQYPGRYLTDVDTSCPAIFEGNPNIVKLVRNPELKILKLEYPLVHDSDRYPHHFIHGFLNNLADQLHIILKPTEWAGAIYIRQEEHFWFSAVYEILGKDVPYWVVNAGHKLDYTAKAWEFARYQEVINRHPDITFVQIGSTEHVHPKLTGNNLINLVGQTNLRQLIRLIYNAYGVLTGVSVPAIMAYAISPHPRFKRLSRASIVIAGGREPNHWQAGPNQQYLHTCGMLDCCDLGGCWKSRVVPLNDGDKKDLSLCLKPTLSKSGQIIPKCMDMITVDEVSNLIKKYMDNLNAVG